MLNKNRQEWLAKRMLSLGASDAAAAIGVSPYKSPLTLYLEKTGELPPVDLSDNELVWYGTELEPIIRRRCGMLLDQQVQHAGPYEILHNANHPYMSATLDGEIVANEEVGHLFIEYGFDWPVDDSPGTLQIKTASPWIGNQFDGEFPIHYQVQCQHELIVAGYDWGILAVLIDRQTRLIPFRRNDEFCDGLAESLRKFWQRVEDRDPPPADGSDSTRDTLARLYPADDGQTIDMPLEASLWDAQLLAAKETRKECEAVIRQCEADLKAAIGDATYGQLQDGTVYSWKLQKRKGFVVEPTEFRVLRRKAIK